MRNFQKKNKELLNLQDVFKNKENENKIEISNYLKQINEYEIESSKSRDKINELNQINKENKDKIQKAEKEILEMKQQSQENEKVLNSQIEIIKNQYKNQVEEEMKKIRKSLIKTIANNFEKSKKNFEDKYSNREKDYDNKFIEFSNLLLNSQMSSNQAQIPCVSNLQFKNISNKDNNIENENVIKKFPLNQETESNNNMINNTNNYNFNNNIINSINENNNNQNNNININNINNTNNVVNNSIMNDQFYTNNASDLNNTDNIIRDVINPNIDNNNNNINNKNKINNNIQNIEIDNKGEYSYECTNSMYLTVYIYSGTEEAEFEIFLRNVGDKKWADDSKLIIDQNYSDLFLEEVHLDAQKSKEERSYKVTVKDLGRYNTGEYKIVFLFYSGGKIHGEKITALIKIKEKDDQKSEIDENIDKINEFRETFNLSEDEYSNEKILETLKENDFNFENAFSSLFN